MRFDEFSERLRALRPTGQDWGSLLAGLIIAGVAIILIVGWSVDGLQHLSGEFFIAGSSLLSGVFLGFLFGIPRSLQTDLATTTSVNTQDGATPGENKPRIRYQANTNLEQISDWLTKILVGVSLTQINSLPSFFDRLGNYFGPSFGSSNGNSQLAVAVVLYFILGGFLFSYLWTRLFLGGELARADLNAVTEQVKYVAEKQEKQELQFNIDTRALSLSNIYFSSFDATKINMKDLFESVKNASRPIKVQLFYQARILRSQSWQDASDRWKIDRTIPIFEALIAADEKNKFHQNHGQLGFALKDKTKPDLVGAEKELTKAIEIRGPANTNGWEIYEFNRAICRIKLARDPTDKFN